MNSPIEAVGCRRQVKRELSHFISQTEKTHHPHDRARAEMSIKIMVENKLDFSITLLTHY
jgi:hypothetical protein